MKIRVDMNRCTGHALCASFAPDIYDLDDYGHCASDGRMLRPEEVNAAENAALSCPEQAIQIIAD